MRWTRFAEPITALRDRFPETALASSMRALFAAYPDNQALRDKLKGLRAEMMAFLLREFPDVGERERPIFCDLGMSLLQETLDRKRGRL